MKKLMENWKRFLGEELLNENLMLKPGTNGWDLYGKLVAKAYEDAEDYQEDAVKGCLSKGRGVINLATAGGKTLIIASLLETIHKQHIDNLQALVIVPDLGLVNQTYGDFNDYNVTFTHTKWTGNNKPVQGSNVIIANLGILQSKNTDTSFLEHFDVVIVDEVHKLRRGNKNNRK